MPSIVHEVLVEFFTQTRALSDLVRVAHGKKLSRLASSDPNFSEISTVEQRIDGFFLVGSRKQPRAWLVLEIQTSGGHDKIRTLPLALEMAQDR